METQTQQQQEQLRTVPIDKVIYGEEFQVRRKLDQAWVDDLVLRYEAGEPVPPLTVAKLEGILILLDGFHRYQALRRLEREFVEVKIVDGVTTHEAGWIAAEANLKHGLKLHDNEYETVFMRYMWAGKYRDQWKQVKSYREISRDLHGCASHTTIARWMKSNFPNIAKLYGDKEVMKRKDSGDLPKQYPFKDLLVNQAIRTFEQGIEMIKGIECKFRSTSNTNSGKGRTPIPVISEHSFQC